MMMMCKKLQAFKIIIIIIVSCTITQAFLLKSARLPSVRRQGGAAGACKSSSSSFKLHQPLQHHRNKVTILCIAKKSVSNSSSVVPHTRSIAPQQYHHQRQLFASVDDEDLTDRSLSFLGTLIKGLSKELQVPTILIPPHADEPKGTTTTLQGWYALFAGVSLVLGNPVYPSAFLGYLYLSRPVDAPDWTAAIAAGLTSGIVSPLLESLGEATGLDDSFLARLPFVLGIFVSGAVLREVFQGRAELACPDTLTLLHT